jgi:hypothetical protein
MVSISLLNATNSSLVFTYNPYTDFNIWISLFIFSIVFLIVSRLVSRDEFGKFLCAVMALLFAVAAAWSSLSLAHVGYTTGATTENISYYNNVTESTTYHFIYPSQQVIASNWITLACVILCIINILNIIDIILLLIDAAKREFEITRENKRERFL